MEKSLRPASDMVIDLVGKKVDVVECYVCI